MVATTGASPSSADPNLHRVVDRRGRGESWPPEKAGTVLPKPVPYRMIVSPGLAGDAAFTRLKSACCATIELSLAVKRGRREGPQ